MHERGSSNSYQKSRMQQAQSASVISSAVGKCTVRLELDGGTIVEAFHTPYIPTNNILVGLLSSHYNILLTYHPTALEKVTICVIIRRKDKLPAIMIELYGIIYSIKRGEKSNRLTSCRPRTSACVVCYHSSLKENCQAYSTTLPIRMINLVSIVWNGFSK